MRRQFFMVIVGDSSVASLLQNDGVSMMDWLVLFYLMI